MCPRRARRCPRCELLSAHLHTGHPCSFTHPHRQTSPPQCPNAAVTGCFRSTRSGRDFSTPYQAITPTAAGYKYGALLSGVIKRSAEDDASDYGGDESDGCKDGTSDSDYVDDLPGSDGEDGALVNGAGDSDGDRMRTSDGNGESTAPTPAAHPRLFITILPRPRPAHEPNPALAIAPAPTIAPTPAAAPTPAIPPKKKHRSARAIQEQRIRRKASRAAKRLQQATSNFARLKRALQARSVRDSLSLAAPFKIADKRVAKTAYIGLCDPKPAPTADPATSDHECEPCDSTSEFDWDSDCEVDSDAGCEVDSADELADPGREARAYPAAEMMESHGFGYMAWDGRVPRPVTDGSGCVVANLIGKPADPNWEGVHRRATELLRKAGGRIRCTTKDMYHRRGNFRVLAQGIWYGTGMTKPANTKNTKRNARVLNSLMKSKEFRRVVSFTNSCFGTWSPRLHKYYGDMMAALCVHHPHLQRNFAAGESVFAGVPSLPLFPPGSTVLIPSAVFTHSNTAIQEGESCYSFTQYTSGGLFRWVEHGFQGEQPYHASLSNREKREEEKRKAGRWAKGMEMYSMIAELNTLYK
ncbi:hypothetical protein FIBSPDRAFT_962386 [Athelia psychrophila]|uniref:Uncharacterized protein n=1 Tax=Athelia psychrophila TaxID=1759441 RepID=A0A166A651_9AGAM|nr:hypothetical protein FIBSPDRAFT_962386 [Fibularhizoctonia sp. CBS 109695]